MLLSVVPRPGWAEGVPWREGRPRVAGEYIEKCDVYGEFGYPIQGKQGAVVRVETKEYAPEERHRGLSIDATLYPQRGICSVEHDVSGNRVLVKTSSRRIETGKLTFDIRPCSGDSGALYDALMLLDFKK